MSLAKRSNKVQSLGQLTQEFPGVEKSFTHVHINHENHQEYDLKATYPILTPKAKSYTFAAYNLYVTEYNSRVTVANREVKKQIRESDGWVNDQPKTKIENIIFIQIGFKGNNRHMSPWEYNQKVDAYNHTFGGPIIPKMKIQTVKQTTEKVFATLLWEYGHQLLQMKRKKEAAGLAYVRDVYKIEVNTKYLENTKGEYGLRMLDYCPDTILNHKNRMIEAGILINSKYRGSERGTLHHINPQILVIFDDFDQKLIYADNQLLKQSQPEVFRDTVIPTRAINKPIVKRDVDKSTSLDKDKSGKPDLHNALPTEDFTRAPSGKMQNPELEKTAAKKQMPAGTHNSTAAGPQKQTKAVENSAFLHKKLRFPGELAKELSQKKHEKSQPLPIDRLVYEANNGTLSRMDFRELLIQDIFKQFSKMYLEHPHFDVVFWPLWLKILNAWLHSSILMNKNGSMLLKTTQLVQYQELCYCILNSKWGALHWINSGRFSPQNPNIYLNPHNNSPGTFAYHFNYVKEKSPKAFAAIRKTDHILKTEGKKARKYSHNLKRLNRKFSEYFNNRIDDQTLILFVEYNMPQEIKQNFQKHFDNYRNNRLKPNTID